jgi:hypothetical protein
MRLNCRHLGGSLALSIAGLLKQRVRLVHLLCPLVVFSLPSPLALGQRVIITCLFGLLVSPVIRSLLCVSLLSLEDNNWVMVTPALL